MTVWAIAVGCVALGYLVGGIPSGVVAGKVYGTDITKAGSGNTGATNVFRTLGWRAALPVALADVAKGAVPALVALLLSRDWVRWQSDLLIVATGVAAMVGHMYSPYFKLRGGKGMATAGGALLVLMPVGFALLLLAFVGMVIVTRVVSLTSLTMATLLPIIIWLLYPDRPVLLFFALVGVPLVFWRHRTNIRRLLRREEPRIEWRRSDASSEGRTS